MDGWQYLSYHELASRIRAALPACGSYEVATMRRYADLADDLAALVSAVDIRGDQEPVWPADTVLDSIVGSPTRSILQKGRAERIAGLLNHLLPELEQQAHSAMTNSVPLVEALESVRVDGIDVHLGWQLQGDQFRRAWRSTIRTFTGGAPSHGSVARISVGVTPSSSSFRLDCRRSTLGARSSTTMHRTSCTST